MWKDLCNCCGDCGVCKSEHLNPNKGTINNKIILRLLWKFLLPLSDLPECRGSGPVCPHMWDSVWPPQLHFQNIGIIVKYVGQTNSILCDTKPGQVQHNKIALFYLNIDFQKKKCIEIIISRRLFSIKEKENHSSRYFHGKHPRDVENSVSQNVLESSDNIENLWKVISTSN